MTASTSPVASVDAVHSTARPPRPWIAALLSLLFPGLGHVYAGRPGRAIVALLALYAGVVVMLLLSFAAPWPALRIATLLLMVLAPLVLLPLDAARVARRAAPGPRRPWQRWWALLGLWIVGAFAVQPRVFAAIKANVAEAFHIPSGAMVPTILPGDYLLTTPRVAHPVARGAVVIYRPAGDEQRYVHRLVGVPGDTLAMRDFRLTVNGKPAPWPHVAPAPGADRSALPHNYGTWGPFVLGADEYFVLGDDYGNSLDGRMRGPLPRAALAGHPGWVYFSRDPGSGAVRWERIGRGIR